MQNEKRKALLEHESAKLKDCDEALQRDMRDWKSMLMPRKQVSLSWNHNHVTFVVMAHFINHAWVEWSVLGLEIGACRNFLCTSCLWREELTESDLKMDYQVPSRTLARLQLVVAWWNLTTSTTNKLCMSEDVLWMSISNFIHVLTILKWLELTKNLLKPLKMLALSWDGINRE